MSKVTEKIDDVYMLYLLSGKHIAKTGRLTKTTPQTIKKYITIKENLDFSLFNNLDKKGKEKLTIGFALTLCQVLNHDLQTRLYPSILSFPNQQRLPQLNDTLTCIICADQKTNFEILPCCQNYLCEACLVTTIATSINDVSFQPIKCPFCSVSFSYQYIQWFLKGMNLSCDGWRRTREYLQSRNFNERYMENLYLKFHYFVKVLKRLKEESIFPRALRAESSQRQEMYNQGKLMNKELIYGPCFLCSYPLPVGKIHRQKEKFRRIKMGSIQRRCANDENQMLVVEPSMFTCGPCRDEDVIVKKCPHCGIKTLKPDGCNYVICGDHRWCFICNERLEVNHNGHNVHYWMGSGSSAYSDKCRKSEKSNLPTFILEKCDCYSCRGKDSLCLTLDCMERTPHEQCDICDPWF
jgi:hypothetical protein